MASASSELNKLIETSLDGKHGYQQAAEHASDSTLKQRFTQLAAQRDRYATELQSAVSSSGGTPTDSGSVAAGLHRAWIGLKDALSGGDGKILAECIRGDESAVKTYQEVLSDDDVPAAAKTVIARQHGEIEQALAELNTMKGQYK